MSQIKKGLFIGNFRDAQDINFLKRNGVTHILCSAAELFPVFPGRFIYKHVQGNDVPSYNLARHFDAGADFIQDGISNGGCVFVHCAAGISRSVSLAIAYFIKWEGMSLQEAYSLIRGKRYIANPNPGFMKQLREFDIKHSNMRKEMNHLQLSSQQQALYNPETSNIRNGNVKDNSELLQSTNFKQMQSSKPVDSLQSSLEKEQMDDMKASKKQTTSTLNSTTKSQFPQPAHSPNQTNSKLSSTLGNTQGQYSFSQQPPLHSYPTYTKPNGTQQQANQLPSLSVTKQPASIPKLSRLQENMIKSKQQQAPPSSTHNDIKLMGTSIISKKINNNIQIQPAEVQKPPLLYNDGRTSSTSNRNRLSGQQAAGGSKNTDLINRYLNMTVQNTYEPKIVTHNIRGSKVKGPNYPY